MSAINVSRTFNSILGAAGTGKSTWLKTQLERDKYFAFVTSSTGISALNVDGITIHSALQYYDSASLVKAFQTGKLITRLAAIAEKYEYLCIDEISMLPGEQLNIICYAILVLNKSYDYDLKLIVLGDAAQLPTVKANKFFFESKFWSDFSHNYLTIVRRQSDREFINFLNCARLGQIKQELTWYLNNIGFTNKIDSNFAGTTILSTNREVNRFNLNALKKINKPVYTYVTNYSGKQKPEWKHIPEKLYLKPSCKIIITINNHREGYCNGDLATVHKCYSNCVEVVLDRTGEVHTIGYETRCNTPPLKQYPIGTIYYLPVKLAYALTIHRVQGLTLDKMQCRITDNFLPNLSGGLYVLFSRIRNYQNLTVVGNERQLIKANFVDPKIKEFLMKHELIVHSF